MLAAFLFALLAFDLGTLNVVGASVLSNHPKLNASGLSRREVKELLAESGGLDPYSVPLSENSNPYWKTFVRGEDYITLQASIRLGFFEVINGDTCEQSAKKLNLTKQSTVVVLEHLDSMGLMKYDPELDSYEVSEIATSHLLKNSTNRLWRDFLEQQYNLPVTAISYLDIVRSRNISAADISKLSHENSGDVLHRIYNDRLAMPVAFAAHHLGLFPFLHANPHATATTVAHHLNISEQHALEILDGLHATGVLARAGGAYALSADGEELALEQRDGAPNPFYWGGTIEVIGGGMITPDALVQRLVQRAAAAADTAAGGGGGPGGDSPMMARVETSEADARLFARHMRAQMQRAGERIARLPLWRGGERVLDVAGGSGHYLAALAAHHPGLSGSVLETPHTDAVARAALASAGLGGRLAVVTGSMWDPAAWAGLAAEGYDTVLYSYVLHDWRPREVTWLLAAAAGAVAAVPGGRVLVHEQFLREGGGSPADKAGFGRVVWHWTDEGAQYRLSDLAAMAAAAGLRLDAVHPADGALSDLAVFVPAAPGPAPPPPPPPPPPTADGEL